ncbi:MAG: polyhydroxyalkanoate synthesis repressor PhaR [Alphaproteobacteria bacterium]
MSDQHEQNINNGDHGAASGDAPIIIKKYANRRLYNTKTSGYVTLEHLNKMVRDGVEFMVCDAKTGDDITRSILTQIILEAEGKDGQTLLPISFLRQLITYYGDQMNHATLPRYLELTMGAFQEHQGQFRKMAEDNMSSMFSLTNINDLSRKNMEMMQNAMKMFNPLAGGAVDGMNNHAKPPQEAAPAPVSAAPKQPTDLDLMKQQLLAMQQQIESLSKK